VNAARRMRLIATGTDSVVAIEEEIQRARHALEQAEEFLGDIGDPAAKVREWLDRARTVAPGLTNAEVAVVERLIEDLS